MIDEPLPEVDLSETQSTASLSDSLVAQQPEGWPAPEALPDTSDDIPHANEVSTTEDVALDRLANETLSDSDSDTTEMQEFSSTSAQPDNIEAKPVVPGLAESDADLEEARQSVDAVQWSELAHTDVLSVTTVTSSRVTSEGITSELQQVMDWARAQNADPMSFADDDPSHVDTSEDSVVEASQATDIAQLFQPASVAGVVSHADSEQSRQKPAETANASELVSAAVPKLIVRSPMRRPLLHRRFQLERPATTSSTGSEDVNRKLRVDQPGGINELPEAAAQLDASIASSVAPETKIVSNAPSPGRRFRIDGPEAVDALTGTDGRRGRTQTLPKHRYIDDPHDSAMRGPHFEITPPRRSNLTSVTGQFLAYLGVLGLTIGTAMVIYGHFGGYSEYTPTGWLVTTVAQMLLFLGVINLVSGGIEQNNDDVSRRITTLGEQLLRIEQVTSDAMRGPKLSPHLYDHPNSEAEETPRETAGVHRE